MAAFDAHFDLDNSEDDSAPMAAPAAYLAAEGADPAEQVEAEDWKTPPWGPYRTPWRVWMIEAEISSKAAGWRKIRPRCTRSRTAMTSAERIRQLELAALKKLKGAIAA